MQVRQGHIQRLLLSCAQIGKGVIEDRLRFDKGFLAQTLTLFRQADFGHAPVGGADAGADQTIRQHPLNHLGGCVQFLSGKFGNL